MATCGDVGETLEQEKATTWGHQGWQPVVFHLVQFSDQAPKVPERRVLTCLLKSGAAVTILRCLHDWKYWYDMFDDELVSSNKKKKGSDFSIHLNVTHISGGGRRWYWWSRRTFLSFLKETPLSGTGTRLVQGGCNAVHELSAPLILGWWLTPSQFRFMLTGERLITI